MRDWRIKGGQCFPQPNTISIRSSTLPIQMGKRLCDVYASWLKTSCIQCWVLLARVIRLNRVTYYVRFDFVSFSVYGNIFKRNIFLHFARNFPTYFFDFYIHR